MDLISQPELLEQPQYACLSAAWFWATKGLNTLADADKFETITRRINGGLNGQADRLKLWAKAFKVLAPDLTQRMLNELSESPMPAIRD